jgi:acetylornithine deacetylase/succinyl-diaminopimelate desuccinylase-like protein
MTSPLPAVLDRIEAGLDASRARWFDLLRIPSISAQPAHAADCGRAAEWLRAELAAIGFEARVMPTPGHPVVLAHHNGTGSGPRLLYYGHYDVQPADPLELWTTPPFDPVLSEGPHGPRISARGAVDDKGQVMMWLQALRGWHEVAGGPPCPVTVLIEGEEEMGSVNLEPFLTEHKDALAADIAIISDTGMWDIDTPAVTTRLRGMVYVELTLHAAERDLHSGLYGGSALNPINALTRILGDLHDSAMPS